jgi:hypothetical protein
MRRDRDIQGLINHLVLKVPPSALTEGGDDSVAVTEEVDVEVDVVDWLYSTCESRMIG